MKVGDKFFVRIDTKNPNLNSTDSDFKDHGSYVRSIAEGRYFLGGEFRNIDGGMVILKAKDIDEAKELAEKDPLISRNLYSYEIFEWVPLVVNEEE